MRSCSSYYLGSLLLLAACQSPEAERSAAGLPTGHLAALYGTWLLVPENSQADTLAYRPNTYRFRYRPRGRPGFRLAEGGRFTRYDLAPGGGLLAQEGTWAEIAPYQIRIHLSEPDVTEPDYTLEMLSHKRGVLKLRQRVR